MGCRKSHLKISLSTICTTIYLINILFQYGHCMSPTETLPVGTGTISTTTSVSTSEPENFELSSITNNINDNNYSNNNDNNNSNNNNSNLDLDKAETKDPKKLEIIKQIRKLNKDGSYTIGYEAEDGTFKIESRDVLGNIKGTYGYVDANGEIKRVSYTSNNESNVMKSSLAEQLLIHSPPSAVQDEPVENDEEIVYIPKQNRTKLYSSTISSSTGLPGSISSTTTRRPSSLAYLTLPLAVSSTTISTPSTTTTTTALPTTTTTVSSTTTGSGTITSTSRSNVIQSIPRRRIYLSSSSTDRSPSAYYLNRQTEFATGQSIKSEPTTTIVYATSAPPSVKSQQITLRPTPLPGTVFKTSEQISRPDKLEIVEQRSKVQSNRDIKTYVAKPVTETPDEEIDGGDGSDVDDDDDVDNDAEGTRGDIKLLSGNYLRRQLNRDDNDEKFEAQQQIIYSQSAGEDSNRIYGGVMGTSRPLFTTTNSPRIPSIVLAARARATQLQNILHGNNNGHSTSGKTTSTTEKLYVRPVAAKQIISTDTEDSDEEPTTESTSENNYLTQSPIPVQIPSNHLLENERRVVVQRRPIYIQQVPRSRAFLRQAPPPGFDFSNGPKQFRLPIPLSTQQQQQQQQQQHQQQNREQENEHRQQHIQRRPEHNAEVEQSQPEQYLKETTQIPNVKQQTSTAATTTSDSYPDPNNLPIESPRHIYIPYRPLRLQPQPQLQLQHLGSGYDQQFNTLVPYNPYYTQRSPYYHQDPMDKPLTARDFERLLNILIMRQQYQRYNNYLPPINPFGQSQGLNPFGYSNLPFGGYQQISRQPISNFQYDPRFPIGYHNRGLPLYSTLPNRLQSPPYIEYENGYQAQEPIPDQQVPYVRQRVSHQQKRHYNNGQYLIETAENTDPNEGESSQFIQDPQLLQNQLDSRAITHNNGNSNGQDYLPSDVREELLYRMLMLAIQAPQMEQHFTQPAVQHVNAIIDPSINPNEYTASTTTQKTVIKPTQIRKPIRSVQILGEE